MDGYDAYTHYYIEGTCINIKDSGNTLLPLYYKEEAIGIITWQADRKLWVTTIYGFKTATTALEQMVNLHLQQYPLPPRRQE